MRLITLPDKTPAAVMRDSLIQSDKDLRQALEAARKMLGSPVHAVHEGGNVYFLPTEQ